MWKSQKQKKKTVGAWKKIEKNFERRQWKVVELDEMHMGFTSVRGTTNAIFMGQFMEMHKVLE